MVPSAISDSIESVKDILAKWNPLEVPDDIARSEYESYALRLCGEAHREVDLIPSFVEILDHTGVEEPRLTAEHYEELNHLAAEIYKAMEPANAQLRHNNK